MMPLVTFRAGHHFTKGGGIWKVKILSGYRVCKVGIVNDEFSEVFKVRGDQVRYRDAIQLVLICIGNHFPSATMWTKIRGIKMVWGLPIPCGTTQGEGGSGSEAGRGARDGGGEGVVAET